MGKTNAHAQLGQALQGHERFQHDGGAGLVAAGEEARQRIHDEKAHVVPAAQVCHVVQER